MADEPNEVGAAVEDGEATVTATAVEATPEDATAAAIRAYFLADRSRMTMSAARKFGVPERDVVEALVGQWPIVRLRKGGLLRLLEELPALGAMRVFVRSRAAVMEVVGTFGGFSETGPFLNVQTDTLDMHILPDEVDRAYAVEKVGHDSTVVTYSFQFFDHEGHAAFKTFLWDGYPDVPAHRVAAFRDLASRFSENAGDAAPGRTAFRVAAEPAADVDDVEPATSPRPPAWFASEEPAPESEAAPPAWIPEAERIPIPLPDGIVPGSSSVGKRILGQTAGETAQPPPMPQRVRRRRFLVRGATVLTSLVVMYLVFVSLVAPYFWYHFEAYPKLTDAPKTAQTSQNVSSDPLNVAFLGDERDLVLALLEAGWSPADPASFLNANRLARNLMANKPFPRALFGEMYLFGRPHDLMYEKPADAKGRHTVRLWKSDELGSGGRPLWIGTAAYGRVDPSAKPIAAPEHHIGPDLDAERDLLVDDLSRVLRLTEVSAVTGFGPTFSGRTAADDSFYTDGELTLGTLSAGAPHDRPASRVGSPLLVRLKDRVMAELKSVLGGSDADE
ncbi:MAG: LssY C-terminal domain-containing protein [Isosphaeraceae bacterium]